MAGVTSERVKLVSEFLQAIRVIKMYAWEEPVSRQIENVRRKELSDLSQLLVLQLVQQWMMFITPVLVTATIFIIFLLLEGELDVATVFTVMAYVGVLRLPVGVFAPATSFFAQGLVTCDRLNEFFNLPEIEPRDSIAAADAAAAEGREGANNPQVHIALEGADFTWERSSAAGDSAGGSDGTSDGATGATLKGITLTARTGELIMVIGKVGSGKSSLLAAILGEMGQTAGVSKVNENLRLAYAAQEPWVRSASVRSNIDFGAGRSGDDRGTHDSKVYTQVVAASQLLPDMRMLPAGDMTMVGERGITLSGGQKARVCFARACHQALAADANVVLLDDPLSAVDAGVAHGLFEQGVMGILKGRTVVLTLNSHYEYLKMADKVVVMSGGEIVAQGKLRDILGAMEREFPEMEWDSAEGVGASKTAAAKTAAGKLANEASGTAEAVVQAGECDEERQAGAEETSALVATNTEEAKTPEAGTKLLTAEDRNYGEVSFGTWTNYFGAAFKDSGSYGGPVLFTIVLLIFASAQAGRIFTDLCVARYSRSTESSAENTVAADAIGPVVANSTTAASAVNEKELEFIATYLSLGAATCVLAFARLKLFTSLALRCSKHLNHRTFWAVVRSPVNLFFDGELAP
jgi:ABC-type bacteriocin/lantibiotic exporter with double-glycine peptidase domain